MPVVDRAILRLATYEMLYVDTVPISVTISEAVELAKAYGGEDESSRFVNGVLGRIALKLEAEAAAGAAADGAGDRTAGAEAGNEPVDAAPAGESAVSSESSVLAGGE